MTSPRPVILFIAMSLDGYIAGPDDDLSFLDAMQAEGDDYGYSEIVSQVDTMILGRRTFEAVLSFGIPWPHAERKTYVLSSTLSGPADHVEFFNGDLAHLVARIREQEGSGIYLDAGGKVVAQALERDLIDRLIISVVPILLGGGTRLFEDGRPSQVLTLERTITYPTGLVQLRYVRERP